MPLIGSRGVISFSFDDAPRSACIQGKSILDRHGVHGTWYIAGGLTDQLEQGRRCHTQADVVALMQAGHHIGCHTFSHQPCDRVLPHVAAAEFDKNAQFLDDCGVPRHGRHFSFPLGALALGAKREAAQRFSTSRITGGGIQTGSVDLNALRSERLYVHSMTQERLRALCEQTASQHAWLIFYTHDIEEDPSEWGCTPALLDSAVAYALAMGCKVLSVAEAHDYWQSNRNNR
jgi:peptidoglycan/xylan/chitin deacetylase (PgdA/CDA1 family)